MSSGKTIRKLLAAKANELGYTIGANDIIIEDAKRNFTGYINKSDIKIGRKGAVCLMDCVGARCATRTNNGAITLMLANVAFIMKPPKRGGWIAVRYKVSLRTQREVINRQDQDEPIKIGTPVELLAPSGIWNWKASAKRSKKYRQGPKGKARHELIMARNEVKKAEANIEKAKKVAALARKANKSTSPIIEVARAKIYQAKAEKTKAAERLSAAEKEARRQGTVIGGSQRPIRIIRRNLDLGLYV